MVSPTARLLEVTDALAEAGLTFLIMGGHAVRHYGVERNTFDFDFHVSAPDLEVRGLDAAVETILRSLLPASTRHLAVVEAVRLACQRAARAADRADKECHRMRGERPA